MNINQILYSIKKLFSDKQEREQKKSSYSDGLLVTLKLEKLDDILDAEAIWHMDYHKEQTAGKLNDQSFFGGLYDALLNMPHIIPGHDAQRNRAIGSKKHFTDVAIFINKERWESEALTGGSNLYVTADRLRANHEEFFKNNLLHNRKPRYCIMPAYENMALNNDEIIIQFGLSVFIPDDDDKQVAQLVFRHDSTVGYALGNWLFFDDKGSRIERPIALYEGQQYLRFAAPESLQSCFKSPKWFSSPYQNATIMVIFNQQGKAGGINYSQGQSHTRGHSNIEAPPSTIINKNGQSYAFYADRQRIGLEFYPVDFQEIQEVKNHQGDIVSKTYIGMQKPVNSGHTIPSVHLSHLALPAQNMLAPDFDQWQLAFNHHGQLIDTLSSNENPFIRFFLKDGHIFYQSENNNNGDRAAETIEQVSSIEFGGKTFDILPSPETISPNATAQAFYQNLIALPAQWRGINLTFPENGTIQLGRNHENCHHNLLKQNGTLLFGQKQKTQTLHDFFFSREHAELTLEGQYISLRQLSESTPIIILDKNKKRINQLLAGDKRIITLESGQAIILGCYVFQIFLPEKENQKQGSKATEQNINDNTNDSIDGKTDDVA